MHKILRHFQIMSIILVIGKHCAEFAKKQSTR